MKLCCPLKTVCLFSHENQIIKHFLLWLKLLFPKQHCAALKIFRQQLYKPEKSSKSSSFRSQRHKELFTFLLERCMKKKDMHSRKLPFRRTSSEKQSEEESQVLLSKYHTGGKTQSFKWSFLLCISLIFNSGTHFAIQHPFHSVSMCKSSLWSMI